jgi:hypothetical protein
MRRNQCAASKCAAIAVLLVLALDGSSRPAASCGFDGVFDGSLGVPHPRSIEVAVSVRRAAQRGLLPPSALSPIAPGAAGLWRATRHLNAVAYRLSTMRDGRARPVESFAMLFGDSALWTRFAKPGGRWSSRIHGPPAGSDETAVITDEAVVAEILDGKLSVETAFANGLIVVDGPAPAESQMRDLLVAALDTAPSSATSADLLVTRTPWRNFGH